MYINSTFTTDGDETMEEYAEWPDGLTDRQLKAAFWLAAAERDARRTLHPLLSNADLKAIGLGRVAYRAARSAMGRYAATVCDVVCHDLPLGDRLDDLHAGLERLAVWRCITVDSPAAQPA